MKLKVRVIHENGAIGGAITETDVILANASSSTVIIGFNVRPGLDLYSIC